METNFNFDPIGQTKTKRNNKRNNPKQNADVAEETTLESSEKCNSSVCAGTIRNAYLSNRNKIDCLFFLSWGNWASSENRFEVLPLFSFREIYELALSSITIEETTQRNDRRQSRESVVEPFDHLFHCLKFQTWWRRKTFRNYLATASPILRNKFEEIWILVRGEK